MREPEEALSTCPTCGQPIEAHKLGLRDYSTWLFDLLPGRVGATDLDAIIDQENHDRDLALEFKPSRYVPRGQARLFNRLIYKGIDVWVVNDRRMDEDELEATIWQPDQDTQNWRQVNVKEFKHMVRAWWDAA